MKKAFAIVVLFILLINITAFAEEFGEHFFEAEKVSLNKHAYGRFPRDYDTDVFEFVAPESGYYAIKGKADKQIRGYLYDQDYTFLYGGSRLSSDNSFFMVAYLSEGQKAYFKVDSLVRQYQDYSVIVEKAKLPFNRIVLGRSNYTTYLEPNTVKTITIPVYFYQNSTRVYNVAPTYPFMMTINSVGLLRGQAAFNLKTNMLEVDLYDENNATITLNIGRDISAKCNIRSIHRVGSTEPDSTGDDQNQEEEETPSQGSQEEEIPSLGGQQDDYFREPEIHKGDVDLNNTVNMNDVVSLLDPLTLSKFTQEQFSIADVTNNGVVDANDALLILRRVSGARK